MTILHRFILITAGASAIFALSACQPTTDSVADTKTNQTIEAVDSIVVVVPDTATETETYTDNTISANDMVADIVPMSEMQADYTKSITRMHDEMMIGMGYNDPDTTFAKSMLGHRRGALDMANLQLKYGSDPSMRQLAQSVINLQQGEINILNKWLASHPDTARAKLETPFVQQEYRDIAQSMLDEMTLSTADLVADMAFARIMLEHFVSADQMATIELKYGTDEELLALAQQIINEHYPNIMILQNWLAANDDALDSDSLSDDTDIEDADIDSETEKTTN